MDNLHLPLSLSLLLLLSGCGPTETERPAEKQVMSRETVAARPRPAAKPPAVEPSAQTRPRTADAAGDDSSSVRLPSSRPTRTLADLLDAENEKENSFQPPEDDPLSAQSVAMVRQSRMPVDDNRAAAAGIRRLDGKHLTLYTDLPASPEVDELPGVFDQAVPQWCEYFGVEPAELADWRMTGFIMREKERFQGTGLLPGDLPPFYNGFQRGYELWLYDQPTAYYRRHLLLHEGTHGFMNLVLGGAGPPWYMEGMAELLGTHRWQQGRLTLRYMPKDKDEAPHWGRVKIVKDEYAAGRGMPLEKIMQYDSRAHLRNEPYAWCWAATSFFDRHPKYRDAFLALHKHVRDRSPRFNQQLTGRLQDEWPMIVEEWQLFVADMEYGYDVARAAVVRRPSEPLAGAATATISAGRGWQSSAIRLEAGVAYRVTAEGRYQVADQPRIWWCEPGGVTIRYDDGRPLGMLLGAVRDDEQPVRGLTPLASPEPIGLGRTIVPNQSGTLYLRINESAAGLADNAGEIRVTISASQ